MNTEQRIEELAESVCTFCPICLSDPKRPCTGCGKYRDYKTKLRELVEAAREEK